jgi:hypothetical protein
MARSDRRHLVTLSAPSGTPVSDGEGGYIFPMGPLDPPTWWCASLPATQRNLERLTAGTVIASVDHALEGDFHPGITTQTQITFEGRTLYVREVRDPEDRHITTIAFCSEVAA